MTEYYREEPFILDEKEFDSGIVFLPFTVKGREIGVLLSLVEKAGIVSPFKGPVAIVVGIPGQIETDDLVVFELLKKIPIKIVTPGGSGKEIEWNDPDLLYTPVNEQNPQGGTIVLILGKYRK